MKIIVINGRGGVGKDSFIEGCRDGQKDWEREIFSISSVDYVKDMAKDIGWDGIKNDKGRRFLSDLKDALSRYNDGPFRDVIKEIQYILWNYKEKEKSTKNLIFFVHAREPEEIERWVRDYGAKTLLIRRPSVERSHNNHADDNVDNYDYDYTYHNVYDLETLKTGAKEFIKWIKQKPWYSDNEEFDIWDREEY